MRWLLTLLFVIGAAFVALMVAAPGGVGDKDNPPGWVAGIGGMLSGFAPQVDRFADGSKAVSVPKDGEASVQIAPDPDHETRILRLILSEGSAAQVIYTCTFTPGSNCKGEAEVMCLGGRISGCKQKKIGQDGSFSVSAGGGVLRLVSDGVAAAKVVIKS